MWDKEGNTDVLICSGTLTEASIAYQLKIPLVAITGSGGWAGKLSGTYID